MTEDLCVTDGVRTQVIRREAVTPEFVAALRAEPHGPQVADMLDEIERLWKRERQLLAVNNKSLERARRFEDESNQDYCEKLLVRGECMRLRACLSEIAEHIEDRAIQLPDALAQELDKLFPDSGEPKPKGRREILEAALTTAEAFISEELETRQSSFLPYPTEEEQADISSAESALAEIRAAKQEFCKLFPGWGEPSDKRPL